MTALLLAAHNGHTSVVELLRIKGRISIIRIRKVIENVLVANNRIHILLL